jgi:hypothetical protein
VIDCNLPILCNAYVLVQKLLGLDALVFREPDVYMVVNELKRQHIAIQGSAAGNVRQF